MDGDLPCWDAHQLEAALFVGPRSAAHTRVVDPVDAGVAHGLGIPEDSSADGRTFDEDDLEIASFPGLREHDRPDSHPSVFFGPHVDEVLRLTACALHGEVTELVRLHVQVLSVLDVA